MENQGLSSEHSNLTLPSRYRERSSIKPNLHWRRSGSSSSTDLENRRLENIDESKIYDFPQACNREKQLALEYLTNFRPPPFDLPFKRQNRAPWVGSPTRRAAVPFVVLIPFESTWLLVEEMEVQAVIPSASPVSEVEVGPPTSSVIT
ncbi:hypothetical protein VNO77_14529 [Canavalia gladiata]|uniref:Uncharacterized protein n=1 Tax=Canavalia gladiata TaxID=3824 RepID=A0AAN9M1X5_CANGL